MGEAPKRIWTGACGKAIVQGYMNRWPGDVEYVRADLAEADYLAGVKAGLEAATSAAFKSCRANDAGYIDENSRLLQRAENEMRLEVVKSIRALDPVEIARAAQKEGE